MGGRHNFLNKPGMCVVIYFSVSLGAKNRKKIINSLRKLR